VARSVRRAEATRGELSVCGSGEGGSEEGAHAATDLGRAAEKDGKRWTSSPAPAVEAGLRVLAYLMAPERYAPFWSTWNCPRGLLSGLRLRAPRSWRGGEPQAAGALVRQEPSWTPPSIRTSSLGADSAQSGGLLCVEAAGFEAV
jgi:hypothetical protein